LTALPESLASLQNLTHLDLRNNQLLALPAALADLPHLKKLDLRWNKLRVLPDWLKYLEQRGCVVLM
ncbi:MAG TPA: leucine-rich repeat domain-containing protein, partial [Phototrophicaceae bacterium]|nr:leucine-rich repeat domain-containing protein [Phototrophicaceae bacterium]